MAKGISAVDLIEEHYQLDGNPNIVLDLGGGIGQMIADLCRRFDWIHEITGVDNDKDNSKPKTSISDIIEACKKLSSMRLSMILLFGDSSL